MSFGTTEDEVVEHIVTLKRWQDDFLKSPCGVVGEGFMSQVMSFPSFSIRNVIRTSGQSGENLTINFEFSMVDYIKSVVSEKARKALEARARKKPTSPGMWKGWIILSPDEGWTVQAYGTGEWSPGVSGRTVEITYGDRRDGFSLPRRITVSEPGGRVEHSRLIASIFGRSRKRVYPFSLRPSGTRRFAPSRAQNRLAVVLFLGAFVAFCMAFALKYYAKRLNKKRMLA